MIGGDHCVDIVNRQWHCNCSTYPNDILSGAVGKLKHLNDVPRDCIIFRFFRDV